jgi:hypothetical protein
LGASADKTLKEITMRLRGKVAVVTGSGEDWAEYCSRKQQ